MKTSKLFLSLLTTLVLAGCSSEENSSTSNEATANGEARYLTVNIVATPSTGTRADMTDQEPGGNATYEEGYAAENYVKNVRFYFFDANGNEANVKSTANGSVNYFDWNPADNTEATDNLPNVEKILNAVIVINPKDKLPTSMVAIVNPDIVKLGGSPLTLAQLQAMNDDYLNNTTLNTSATTNDNPFLMTSTVYASDGQKMNEVSLKGHLFTSENEAKDDPVEMYVERVLAKVVFNQGTMSNTIETANIDGQEVQFIKAKDSNGEEITTTDGKVLYIRLLGWNVTGKIDNSYLIKNINAESGAWSETKNWGSNGSWNYPTYYRSFWAVNPDDATVPLPTVDQTDKGGYGNFNDACTITDFKAGVTYCQENAANHFATGLKDDATTKVIMGAQLYYKDGTTFKSASIYQFANNRYADSTACKTAMLTAADVKLYKVTKTVDNEVTYGKIEASDVTLKSAIDAGAVTEYSDNSESGTDSYRSYIQKSTSDQWFTMSKNSEGKDVATAISDAEANKLLSGATYAQVYNEGKSYFYFDIRHLGYGIENVDFGWYGVVRNHIYQTSISGITGLGTPVPDNGEITIVPEKPDNETYVAARINILSWRVVNNNIDLQW